MLYFRIKNPATISLKTICRLYRTLYGEKGEHEFLFPPKLIQCRNDVHKSRHKMFVKRGIIGQIMMGLKISWF